MPGLVEAGDLLGHGHVGVELGLAPDRAGRGGLGQLALAHVLFLDQEIERPAHAEGVGDHLARLRVVGLHGAGQVVHRPGRVDRAIGQTVQAHVQLVEQPQRRLVATRARGLQGVGKAVQTFGHRRRADPGLLAGQFILLQLVGRDAEQIGKPFGRRAAFGKLQLPLGRRGRGDTDCADQANGRGGGYPGPGGDRTQTPGRFAQATGRNARADPEIRQAATQARERAALFGEGGELLADLFERRRLRQLLKIGADPLERLAGLVPRGDVEIKRFRHSVLPVLGCRLPPPGQVGPGHRQQGFRRPVVEHGQAREASGPVYWSPIRKPSR